MMPNAAANNPVVMLLDRIRQRSEIKVVAFGENHFEPSEFRAFIRRCLGPLAALSFRTIGLELRQDFQPTIERYQKYQDVHHLKKLIREVSTSYTPTNPIKLMDVSEEHVSFVEDAVNHGQKLEAVDCAGGGTKRNNCIADNVRTILTREEKVILIFGSIHIGRINRAGYMSVVDILEGEAIPVFSVGQIKNCMQLPGLAWPIENGPVLFTEELRACGLDRAATQAPCAELASGSSVNAFAADFDATFWAREPQVGFV